MFPKLPKGDFYIPKLVLRIMQGNYFMKINNFLKVQKFEKINHMTRNQMFGLWVEYFMK